MIYTIGHSNRTHDEFFALLSSHGIESLVDVRAYPFSKRYPQFQQDSLREQANNLSITYHWAGRQLGGMRRAKDDSKHIALSDEGFRGYADHMETDLFQTAAQQLINLSAKLPLAIMCAERNPDSCHRSYLSDYLVLQGVDVHHILLENETKAHLLNPNARRESANLIYDRLSTGQLDFS